MNYRYYLLIIFMMGTAAPGFAQTKTKADSLHDAGIMRPLAIVQEEPRWNITSTDLYTAWISSGLYGFYGPQPKILLDGIPVDADFFGWQNLNMLPIFVNNINHAQSLFDPQVYKQTLASAGLINFKTAPLDSGFTAQGFYYIGNETSDPGPWAYDPQKVTKNIDRWGPDQGLSLFYLGNGWYAKALYLMRQHKPKDLALSLRLHYTASLLGTNTQYFNHQIYAKSHTGLVETGYTSERWKIKVRALLGTNEDYLFLQPFMREIPVQTAYRQFALQSNYDIGSWKIKGRYIRHKKTIDKRIDLHTYIFDWNQISHTASLSTRYNSQTVSFKPGIIYEQIYTGAPGLNNQEDKVTTLYLNGSVLLGKGSRLYLQNALDFHDKTYAGTMRLGSSIKITGNWSINPEIYYSQVLPIRQHSFTYWVNRGYTFGDTLGISFEGPHRVLENKLLAVNFGNEFALDNHITLSLNQQFIHHYTLNVPWQIVTYNRFTNTMPGTFTVRQESGERLSFLATLQHSFSSLFQHSLSIHLQRTLSGSDRYKNYFKQIPDTKIQYQFDIFPVPDLILSLNAAYRSSTEWVELEALEGRKYRLPGGIPIRLISGAFHTQTPSYVNVSLSARKWFWDRRLSAQFSIQNLLDKQVRMHTMGASLYPKFNFKISVRL